MVDGGWWMVVGGSLRFTSNKMYSNFGIQNALQVIGNKHTQNTTNDGRTGLP